MGLIDLNGSAEGKRWFAVKMIDGSEIQMTWKHSADALQRGEREREREREISGTQKWQFKTAKWQP